MKYTSIDQRERERARTDRIPDSPATFRTVFKYRYNPTDSFAIITGMRCYRPNSRGARGKSHCLFNSRSCRRRSMQDRKETRARKTSQYDQRYRRSYRLSLSLSLSIEFPISVPFYWLRDGRWDWKPRLPGEYFSIRVCSRLSFLMHPLANRIHRSLHFCMLYILPIRDADSGSGTMTRCTMT